MKTNQPHVLDANGNIKVAEHRYLTAERFYPAEGRLSLSSDEVVPVGDLLAQSTLYYLPYLGNGIAVYTGPDWELLPFQSLSLSLASLLANTNYDIFVGVEGAQLTLSAVAWASATARSTALVRYDGVLVADGAPGLRYLGTLRMTAVAGQSEDSAARRFLWNAYHRLPRLLSRVEATVSWNYAVNAWRQANNSAANQLEVVSGLAEEVIELSLGTQIYNNASNRIGELGIGKNALDSVVAEGYLRINAASYAPAICRFCEVVPQGYTYYAALERAASAAQITIYGSPYWYLHGSWRA